MSNVTFVILSFEGPDAYSHAGGLGTRVGDLSRTLAQMGFETHLFFIGDPSLPGREWREEGRLQLHRWCQWISRYHPDGVYDGEEGKRLDWEHSLPPWLESEILAPKVAAGDTVIVIGEEWHTASSIIAIHELVARRGWGKHVHLLWNANSTFSFHRVDWGPLRYAATITTVSRYMKHVMWGYGVDARVIPNGIPESWLRPLDRKSVVLLSRLFHDRLTLAKVARFDPDKRWFMAVDAVAEMKRLKLRPLFFARGGMEGHGYEVLGNAHQKGLQVAHVQWNGPEVETLVEAIRPVLNADMLNLQGYLSEPQRRVLFHAVDAVLANSGVEPFGLVGLETMSVGGVALVGCTGEDYMTPGHDAISLQTSNPSEIVYNVVKLCCPTGATNRLRRAARRTAARYTWRSVIQGILMPFLEQLGVPQTPRSNASLFDVPKQPVISIPAKAASLGRIPLWQGLRDVPAPAGVA
ncbi:MAG: glycosyltransferase [Chloroflexi bacterium]|nr:glycosyltransferase [Chloroflexota bacterium]